LFWSKKARTFTSNGPHPPKTKAKTKKKQKKRKQMEFPVLCFSCGKVLGNKWEQYLRLAKKAYAEQKQEYRCVALDSLCITRECCRRIFLTHIPTHSKAVQYSVVDVALGRSTASTTYGRLFCV
jgi:DNA-directed RNA polymerase I, II, and III subunit RPABC5